MLRETTDPSSRLGMKNSVEVIM